MEIRKMGFSLLYSCVLFSVLLLMLVLSASQEFHAKAEEFPRVVFVVLDITRPDQNQVLLHETISTWREQLQALHVEHPSVISASDTFSAKESVTIVPLLPKLAQLYEEDQVDWFFFASEYTQLNFPRLGEVLNSYHQQNKSQFIGHSVYDLQPSIIHHFLLSEGPHTLYYPLSLSGFALSSSLLHVAAGHAQEFEPMFTIDPVFELSLFLLYMDYPPLADMFPVPIAPHPSGVTLTNVPEFCACDKLGDKMCATSCHRCNGINSVNEELSKVFFAVKTCHKFHNTRLKIVQETWASMDGIRIKYFSDKADPALHTVYSGVENTNKGHCAKTMAIVEFFYQEKTLYNTADWLVIADDDTLLSVPNLLQLLGQYNSSNPMLLGEVYGYRAAHQDNAGYLFITGGGGMVLSRSAVSTIMESKLRHCITPDAPDDMHIGNLATLLDIDIIHSFLFHQDQPRSYHPGLLAGCEPVSFHRHSPEDPYHIYQHHLHNQKHTGSSDDKNTTNNFKIKSEL